MCLFYLVAKSSVKGDSAMEWRISFSLTEGFLCCDEFFQDKDNAIRQCWILTKSLMKEHLGPPKILSSYHLKSTIFKLLETMPAIFWSKYNLYNCILKVLEEFEHCLAVGLCPSFFIPQYNTLEGVHSDFLQTAAKQVYILRQNFQKDPMNIEYFNHMI
ncbi:nucleotidyltransferase MB21D2-like [Saccoglossus kowalevskii]